MLVEQVSALNARSPRGPKWAADCAGDLSWRERAEYALFEAALQSSDSFSIYWEFLLCLPELVEKFCMLLWSYIHSRWAVIAISTVFSSDGASSFRAIAASIITINFDCNNGGWSLEK